jgi:uncharacterized membrane protein YhiD involved in acid resistance
MSRRFRRVFPLLLAAALVFAAPLAGAAKQKHKDKADEPPQDLSISDQGARLPEVGVMDEVRHAGIRLPLAALFGTILAMRPKRRGTPPRQPAVIQTQIILSIVGALVMLVVGTNLARAFGVVGAAGLVRYRAKVEDPKDAGVMLSTLALGLACGVGQYVLAAISTVFILVALWIVESFEPETRKLYALSIKTGDDTDDHRPQFEAILQRHNVDFALQTSSDDEVTYEVHVPLEVDRDRITTALLQLDPHGHASVEWSEKKAKSK